MDDQLEKIRHSSAHVLAQAVLQLYPDAKLAIGPAIEDGFYYDFDLGGKTFSDEDLKQIEKKMKAIIKQNQQFEHYLKPSDEAIEYIKGKKQPYKLEMAEELKKEGEKKLGFYRMIGPNGAGMLVDLCKGPHVKSTKEIGAFKLLKVAGAYWRGDEKNTMLQRIYGTAFATAAELEHHLKTLEEAKKRDHRKLGTDLGLFTLIEEVGPGLPLFYPRGARLRQIVESLIESEQERRGYQAIWVPHLTRQQLYEVSGHLGKYDAMYPPMKLPEGDYYLKPMNCPHFMMLYKSLPHSYRELPVRYTCTSTVYRHEKSGELSGLTRVRSVTQDDCHVFCRPDQIEEEINLMIEMINEIYGAFALTEYRISLSVSDPKRPQDYIGEPAVWQQAEKVLERIMKKHKAAYQRHEGEAAFYGPKLDFIVKDAIGREWQLSTIQLDFSLPQRFGLHYIDETGKPQTPVVIHRAILGSTERFLGIIIEHFAGAFPTWLAPVQVQVIPVGQDFVADAKKFVDLLAAEGVRVVLDDANETVGNKVRKAEKLKIPYMLVIGEKEVKSHDLHVRIRGVKEVAVITQKKFIERLHEEIKTRKNLAA